MLPTTMEDDVDGKEKSNKEKRREKEQRRRGAEDLRSSRYDFVDSPFVLCFVIAILIIVIVVFSHFCPLTCY